MKRWIYVVVLIIIMAPQLLFAQDEAKLTVPASPAFSILNFEPSAVMRPTTAKSLSSDILNAFDKDGKLLMNLGLEVAPYWLASHPKLSRQNYLNPNLGQTILRSLSLSAATVKDSASGNNKLGAGLRFKLYNGEPAGDLGKLSAQLKTKTTVIAIISGIRASVGAGAIDTRQKAIASIDNMLTTAGIDPKIVTETKNDAIRLQDDYTDDPAGIKSFLDDVVNARAEAYKGLAKKISDMLYQRKGFIVEMAAASGFNTSKNNSLEKIGFWTNVSYTLSPDDYITFTTRYMFKNRDTLTTNFDAGFGFLKKAADFNISAEAMLRHQSAEIPDINSNNQPITRIEKNFTYRLAVQGSFKVSQGISLNLSFGRDFDSPFINRSGFFSILGLNYSIFSKEIPGLK